LGCYNLDSLLTDFNNYSRLESQDESTERFRKLLHTAKSHWSHTSHVNFADGFDWLLGVLFLLFGGDEQKTWDLLSEYAEEKHAIYVWPMLATVSQFSFTKYINNLPTITSTFISFSIFKDN